MAELTDETTGIGETVRERYAAAARAVIEHQSSGEATPTATTSSCCGSSVSTTDATRGRRLTNH